MLDFRSFSHLSFDCYGTLIDWEAGILGALLPVLERHGVALEESQALRLYAQYEAEAEAGPYRPYAGVLRQVMEGMADELGFRPSGGDLVALGRSVGSWPPFDDTVAALARLKERYKLVILSNIDDSMFAQTAQRLQTEFDHVITAQQVGSYKPSRTNFRYALDRLGVDKDQVLHVAQSLFHDHVPAKELGLKTVRVNRPSRCPGVGVAPPAEAVPDLEVSDLSSLADLAGL